MIVTRPSTAVHNEQGAFVLARILIIDADLPMRATLRRILDHAGHEILEAPRGSVGLRLYGDTPVDLAVINLLTPDQEGLETMQALRRLSPQIKLVAMVEGGRWSALELLRAAHKYGAHTALIKPFSEQEVRNMVSTLLS